MTDAAIFVFALVLLAGTNVGLGSLIYATRREARATRSIVDKWRQAWPAFAERLKNVEKQSPTTLAAEVAELSEAVARLKATHQRFQGRFDQFVTQQLDTGDVGDAVDDPKWNALMRAQSAQKPNGSG
jgi:hypothetical protein